MNKFLLFLILAVGVIFSQTATIDSLQPTSITLVSKSNGFVVATGKTVEIDDTAQTVTAQSDSTVTFTTLIKSSKTKHKLEVIYSGVVIGLYELGLGHAGLKTLTKE